MAARQWRPPALTFLQERHCILFWSALSFPSLKTLSSISSCCSWGTETGKVLRAQFAPIIFRPLTLVLPKDTTQRLNVHPASQRQLEVSLWAPDNWSMNCSNTNANVKDVIAVAKHIPGFGTARDRHGNSTNKCHTKYHPQSAACQHWSVYQYVPHAWINIECHVTGDLM